MRNTSRRAMVAGVAAAALLLGSVGISTAGKAPKGKDLYKEHCKTCHLPDSPNGEYTPMTLIQDQWKRFFEKKFVKSHKAVKDPKHGNKPVIEVITPENLEKIKTFSIEHAADSENPMTCG